MTRAHKLGKKVATGEVKGKKVGDYAQSGHHLPPTRQQGLDLPEWNIDLVLLTRHLLRLLSLLITNGGA